MAYGLSAPYLVLKERRPPSFLICCKRFCCLVRIGLEVDGVSLDVDGMDASAAADIEM